MNASDKRFWPFSQRTSLAFAAVLLVVLSALTAMLKATPNWPGAQSGTVVFLGVLLLGFAPVLIALLDIVIVAAACFACVTLVGSMRLIDDCISIILFR